MTPRKQRRKVDSEEADEEIITRWVSCVGFPLQVYRNDENDSDDRRACQMCGSKTKFYCIGCRAFFCLDNTSRKKKRGGTMNKMLYYLPTFLENGSRGDDRIFQKACFHQKHEAAYRDHHQMVCMAVPEGLN